MSDDILPQMPVLKPLSRWTRFRLLFCKRVIRIFADDYGDDYGAILVEQHWKQLRGTWYLVKEEKVAWLENE